MNDTDLTRALQEENTKLYNQLMETEKDAQRLISEIQQKLTDKSQWTDLYFGQLRNIEAKLKEYEDTGLTPEEIKAKVELRENCFNQMKSNYEKLLKMWDSTCDGYATLWKELQAYKNAEEQGLLIKLPCKVGDVVHKIRKCRAPGCKTCGGYKRVDNCYCEYKARIFETSFIYSYIDDYGKTVFLTREAAEEALKGDSL